MDLSEITAIVRRRSETGDYGNAHLRVTRRVATQMRIEVPEAPGSYPPGVRFMGPLDDLLGIPVVVDDGLPFCSWRLVDNGTGEILAAGLV